MTTKSKLTLYERALRDMPASVCVDPLSHKTMEDLRYAAQIQLDLIDEGQDGTDEDDPRPIRRWIKKYGGV